MSTNGDGDNYSGIYSQKEIDNCEVDTDEYWDAVKSIYSYIKKRNHLNNVELKEDVPNEMNKIEIEYYKCLECKNIYFPSPMSGIEWGDTHMNTYKCQNCYQKCKDFGLTIFDATRDANRKSALTALTEKGTNLELEEKCPICLDYLLVCENDVSEQSEKEKNVFLLCGHKMCRKCYYNNFRYIPYINRKCPICRARH